ncbi:helix-turn-helix transcriptional regulator [Staphylococcus capitis]|uniref:helix-turn-helix transcriptional regulator n=1 Tax=Staphylococcus capitis TaxID=29388 RepID=UPI00115E7113|nr:response regulator transcription factor [Staphylococcus capitis]MBW4836426.1 AraC family transcriptional regulator [Staphylococcaceae bacterium]MBW4842531.1 AraC family transcriptional regulator [Staphylococcaceae bacterium]MCC3755409.1 AraC family transcriptional regulator [Staphylococcus capitis]MDH8729738.1 helix-turn-helix transcriptional regulator [Staphylococcus capitis]MDH8922135.1 helix-turn-helix transcriptional regulator [Staphylococcus capitis]
MSHSCLHILSKNEYSTTRCQDGILLFWPIEGSMHLQQFRKQRTINNELYIVNNMDVFGINDNGTTLEIYISSDWFAELGYAFFDYHYTAELIKSTNEIKYLMAQLALNYIDGNTEKEYELINKIVEMLAQEASIDKKIAEDQYIYAFYGDLKDELDYIYNHMSERLTLRDISNQLYISKSNLSSQFHTLIGMGFKKYVDTLKISKSIEMLLTTNKTISQISDALGFSNASTYSKLFKNYLSVTPNEYRTMKKYDKYNGCTDETVPENKKRPLKKLIRSVIPNDVSDIYDEIRIDNSQIVNASPFYSVIQIHTIEEIKLLFLEGLYQKMGYEGSNIIFYFMPYLYEYGKLLTQNEKNYISQTIIENDLHIAFNVNEIEHINDLIESFKTSLKQLDKKNHNSNYNYEIQFIFNLNDKDIRSIYRDILKMQNTHINYTIGLDISCMVDDPAQFKSLEAQIKRLKFDYLYIDNAQLTSPYLMDSNEGLLLKNVLQLKHLSVNLNQFDFSKENLIFLNLVNHQLLNNEEIDLSHSAPLLYLSVIKLKEHFSGYGLNLFSHPDLFNSVHLFDENGFKTTYGLIFNDLSWMINQNKVKNGFYNIIDSSDRYLLYLYDWRVVESESSIDNFNNIDIYINFCEEELKDEYICMIVKVDNESGNINHIIPPNLRNKYQWSTKFLIKVEDNFRPNIEIFEHDFTESSLKLSLKYNSAYLVKIYKKNNKIKKA